MGKHTVSKRAVCPFYKHEDPQVIYCNGIQPGSVIHLAFSSKTDAKEYKTSRCHSDWCSCEIACMLCENSIEKGTL